MKLETHLRPKARVHRWCGDRITATRVAENVARLDPAAVVIDHRDRDGGSFAVVIGTFDHDALPGWAELVWHLTPEAW